MKHRILVVVVSWWAISGQSGQLCYMSKVIVYGTSDTSSQNLDVFTDQIGNLEGLWKIVNVNYVGTYCLDLSQCTATLVRWRHEENDIVNKL